MKTPTAAIVRQGASGRLTQKMAGSTTTTNLMATKSSGGTPSMPQSMTTKLNPHSVATAAASKESRRVMTDSLALPLMKHQRMMMHGIK